MDNLKNEKNDQTDDINTKINRYQFLKDFYKIQSTSERSELLLKYSYLFTSAPNSIVIYPSLVLPNTFLTQTYSPTISTGLDQDFTVTSNLPGFTVPYKVSFTITANVTNGAVLQLSLGIRDVQTTPLLNPSIGTFTPDVGTNGNWAQLGAQYNNSTIPFAVWTSTNVVIPPAPQTSAIYTIYESAPNVLTYNVNDSLNYINNTTYLPLVINKTSTNTSSSFVGSTRNIFINLSGYQPAASGIVSGTITIVRNVN
jgi:hypothetical protein